MRSFFLILFLFILPRTVSGQDFVVYDNQSIVQAVEFLGLNRLMRGDSINLHKIFTVELVKFRKTISNNRQFCGPPKALENFQALIKKDHATLVKLDALIQDLPTVKDSLSAQLADKYTYRFHQEKGITLVEKGIVLSRDSSVEDQTSSIISFIKAKGSTKEMVRNYNDWLKDQIQQLELNNLLKDWLATRF